MATCFSVIDMAGLARGAKAGEGLGNAHISRFSAFDGVYNCVGAFDDPDNAITENEFDHLGHADGCRRNMFWGYRTCEK
jgi:ribosome-binding ATPase YchF (GTP1/OBG family)